MKLELTAAKQTWNGGEAISVRLLALNDSYEPIALDRQLLIGPNPIPQNPRGLPFPVSVEPLFEEKERNVVMLNPWGVYGRERSFPTFPAGQVVFHGYLLQRPVEGLPPKGPSDPQALAVAAEPLVLTIIG